MKDGNAILIPGDIVGIIGRVGCGKSALINDLALSREFKQIVSHDPHGAHNKISTLKIDIHSGAGCMKGLRNLTDSLIIIDSLRLILSKESQESINFTSENNNDFLDIIKDDFLDIIKSAKENRNIIVYVYFSASHVPLSLISATTKYFLFNTNENERVGFKDSPVIERIVRLQSQYVSNFAHVHGRGVHRLSPEYNGKNGFPYIMVDCELKTAKDFNMDNK